MTQQEQVINKMSENGGFATLGFLNQNVDVSSWKTKTPFATIRRIVQDERFFFKIKPGLWALKEYKEKLPLNIFTEENIERKKIEEFNHAYYQGLLVEIGNIRKMQTFVPYQDKNKEYLNIRLGSLTSIEKFYIFSYESIVKKAITIDVTWFNERKMPHIFFEVEHSTGFERSFIKFVDLQDFNVQFFIIADKVRRKEYETKIDQNAFSSIKSRVQFMSYDRLSEWHTKSYEIIKFENKFNF